jgi:hypothetical protein
VRRTANLQAEITAGLVAGLAAGAIMKLFLFVVAIPSGDPLRALLGTFAATSVALLGTNAANNLDLVPFGVFLHFCVAVGWALGYVHLARSQPQLVRQPWISGAGFGIVVYVFMQIVILGAGQYHRPSSPAQLETGLVAHIVFYGMPVALVVSRMLRSGSGAATA